MMIKPLVEGVCYVYNESWLQLSLIYQIFYCFNTWHYVFFLSVDTAESSKMELLEKTLLETSEV